MRKEALWNTAAACFKKKNTKSQNKVSGLLFLTRTTCVSSSCLDRALLGISAAFWQCLGGLRLGDLERRFERSSALGNLGSRLEVNSNSLGIIQETARGSINTAPAVPSRKATGFPSGWKFKERDPEKAVGMETRFIGQAVTGSWIMRSNFQ